MKQRGFRYCSVCQHKLHSNGQQPNGKQRWRCRTCGTGRIRPRADVAARNQLQGFVSYLLGMLPRKEYGATTTMSRRYVACWETVPRPFITGEVFDYLLIDATAVGHGVVAIARTSSYVINWQHGDREKSQLWLAVLAQLPCPHAIVCDGQKGILKALDLLWPTAVIQRCLVHVQRNIRGKLTANPQSEAGKDLQWLIRRLFAVNNAEQMPEFVAVFELLQTQHAGFLCERTQNPDPNGKRTWWYTHRGVRSAYNQIAKLLRDDQLFAFITHPELQLPKQTNRLEGGTNASLSELLHRHRGLSPTHQRRLTDWYLDSQTEEPYLTRRPEQKR
jgi:putative transposase